MMANSTPPASITRASATRPRTVFFQQVDSQESMRAMAEETGGRVYYNSNDLVRGFKEAARDSEHYYLLGYYLDAASGLDGTSSP